MALRNLNFDRFHFVGAASVVSLVGDIVKTTIYYQGALIATTGIRIMLYPLVLIPFAVLVGKMINDKIGERTYSA